jgi:hypothetical protein
MQLCARTYPRVDHVGLRSFGEFRAISNLQGRAGTHDLRIPAHRMQARIYVLVSIVCIKLKFTSVYTFLPFSFLSISLCSLLLVNGENANER